VLTVLYEKDFVNCNHYCCNYTTTLVAYSVHNIVQSCLYYLQSHNHWSALLLRTLLQYYTPNHALRSVAQCLLEQLHFSTEFGKRSFSYFAL